MFVILVVCCPFVFIYITKIRNNGTTEIDCLVVIVKKLPSENWDFAGRRCTCLERFYQCGNFGARIAETTLQPQSVAGQ